MKGYKEAEVIDERINKLYKRYPITKENALKWMTFCRVISTTLNIISIEAEGKLQLEGSNK